MAGVNAHVNCQSIVCEFRVFPVKDTSIYTHSEQLLDFPMLKRLTKKVNGNT